MKYNIKNTARLRCFVKAVSAINQKMKFYDITRKFQTFNGDLIMFHASKQLWDELWETDFKIFFSSAEQNKH